MNLHSRMRYSITITLHETQRDSDGDMIRSDNWTDTIAASSYDDAMHVVQALKHDYPSARRECVVCMVAYGVNGKPVYLDMMEAERIATEFKRVQASVFPRKG